MNWNSHYYDILKHYYYEPGKLNRQSIPGQPKPVAEVFSELNQQEVSLNHILTLFFVLAPFFMARVLAKSFKVTPVDDAFHVYGREVQQALNLKKALQPDLFMRSTDTAVSLEMKIDHTTSLKQLAQYCLLHAREEEVNKFQGSHYLIYLGPDTFADIWPANHKMETPQAMKAAFKSYSLPSKLGGWELGIHGQETILKMVRRLQVSFLNYRDLGRLLEDERQQLDPDTHAGQVYSNVVSGLWQELKNRELL